MKIVNFIGTLKKQDGVAQVILALIREAKKHNIESMIVTGWAEDLSMTSAPIVQIPSVIFPLYKEYRLPFPGMRGFEQHVRAFQPDVIHVHSPDTSAWAAVKYAKKYAIPIVATHHTDFSRDLSYYHLAFLRPLVWRMLKKLYGRMGAVTTPSVVTTDELAHHGIKQLHTIPWGVDFERFNISFRSQEWRKKILGTKTFNTQILLCVCRLAWEKDLRTLAETYELLRASRNDFAMVVAEDGPARKELERLMPGAVFLGYLGEKELSQAYASSDIFLFPSSRETFGNVTIEAMASGSIPIVANAGGSKTIVRDGENGLIAQPQSAHDFYQKAVILL
ncbi:MAG: glycosyltransferase family 1 protein, partial [Patescibacteria group bacterium]